MVVYRTLAEFYSGKDFSDLKTTIKAERTAPDGLLYCAHCNKPMIAARDIIAHHIEPLTLENVNDCNITLNPDNIQLVHFRCHNEIHERFGRYTRHVYLVYGAPCAGKKTFVAERAGRHDLIVDIDRIYSCISNNAMYDKSERLFDNVQAVRDALLDTIKTKRGRWVNAWIIGGFPYERDRTRYASIYGAECIYIDVTPDEAKRRLANAQDRDVKAYERFIDEWFEKCGGMPPGVSE